MIDEQLRLHEAYRKTVIDIHTQNFNRAEAYTKLILVAGFGGFFGLWHLVKDDLPHLYAHIAALCMIVSAVFFVGFEIAKMIVLGRSHRSIAAVVIQKYNGPPDEFLRLFSKVEYESIISVAKFNRVWNSVLIVTVGFGLVAIAILVVALINQIVGELS